MRKSPLKVEIADGLLTISIGIETMNRATAYGLEHTYGSINVTDHDVFAVEVLRELKDESEDGTTLIHRMLDQATAQAIEQGAEGVDVEDA